MAKGEPVSLLGPSGCGKGTTLRMIAGRVAPSQGHVRIARNDVTRLPPYRRSIGVMFQNHVLFPYLTALETVGFGLPKRHKARAGGGRVRSQGCIGLGAKGISAPMLPVRAFGRTERAFGRTERDFDRVIEMAKERRPFVAIQTSPAQQRDIFDQNIADLSMGIGSFTRK